MSIYEQLLCMKHCTYGYEFYNIKIITVNNKTNFTGIYWIGPTPAYFHYIVICEYNEIISDECIIILNIIKQMLIDDINIKKNNYIILVKLINDTILEKNNNIDKLNTIIL